MLVCLCFCPFLSVRGCLCVRGDEMMLSRYLPLRVFVVFFYVHGEKDDDTRVDMRIRDKEGKKMVHH